MRNAEQSKENRNRGSDKGDMKSFNDDMSPHEAGVAAFVVMFKLSRWHLMRCLRVVNFIGGSRPDCHSVSDACILGQHRESHLQLFLKEVLDPVWKHAGL
jgi:hypothetical protein